MLPNSLAKHGESTKAVIFFIFFNRTNLVKTPLTVSNKSIFYTNYFYFKASHTINTILYIKKHCFRNVCAIFAERNAKFWFRILAPLSAKLISRKKFAIPHLRNCVAQIRYFTMFILLMRHFLFLEMKVSPPGNFFMLFWGSPRYVSFHFWIIRFYSAGFNFYVFLSQVNFD